MPKHLNFDEEEKGVLRNALRVYHAGARRAAAKARRESRSDDARDHEHVAFLCERCCNMLGGNI